jgi:hypothetical protein
MQICRKSGEQQGGGEKKKKKGRVHSDFTNRGKESGQLESFNVYHDANDLSLPHKNGLV